ncbi:hypothetical protein FI667_g6535, partial [Globisporangium splendens]
MAPDPDPAALEWSCELVPSFPLPVLDLSRSLKSRYLPEFLLQRIDDFLAQYNKPLFFCYALSLMLSISVPLLDAKTGCYVALTSALLGLPLGLGSLGTLRYDVRPPNDSTHYRLVRLSKHRLDRRSVARSPRKHRDWNIRRPSFVQQMQYVKYNTVSDSRRILLPIRIQTKAQFPGVMLALLYATGVIGLLLSFIALTREPQQPIAESHLSQLLKNGRLAFVLTASFTITIAGFYQSELLVALATSFDFVFYALQLTSTHISLCVVYEWDVSRCLGVAASWLWIHWVLTLDALTPMMKTKLKFRTRFGIPVVAMFILWYVIMLFHILSDSGPKDRIIWEGNIWSRHLQVRVVPFYFSRLVTLTLWSVRMVNRLVMSANEDATILRGAVTYDNYLVSGKRKKSRAGPRTSRFIKCWSRVAPKDTVEHPAERS